MPARVRRLVLSDEWKQKIKTSQIMNRLMGHIDGTVEMTSTQIKAADILLKKVVPDLARQELTGPDGKDIKHTVTIKVVGN